MACLTRIRIKFIRRAVQESYILRQLAEATLARYLHSWLLAMSDD